MKKEGLILEKEILKEKRKKINEELLEKKRSFDVIDKKLNLSFFLMNHVFSPPKP